jgi:hypothetical protein
LSGVIVASGTALYVLLSSHSEREVSGAARVGGGFLATGPFVGCFIGVAVAGLVYVPVNMASRRIIGLTVFLLPIIGSLVGLTVAFVFSMREDNLILPVYLILASWGGLGVFLFVLGAGSRKLA